MKMRAYICFQLGFKHVEIVTAGNEIDAVDKYKYEHGHPNAEYVCVTLANVSTYGFIHSAPVKITDIKDIK